MTCHNRQTKCKRFGKDRRGLQRYRCRQCSKTYLEPHARPLDEMRLPLDKALLCLRLLLEGVSVRSTERVTGAHRDTIMSLLVLAGNSPVETVRLAGNWPADSQYAVYDRGRQTLAH